MAMMVRQTRRPSALPTHLPAPSAYAYAASLET